MRGRIDVWLVPLDGPSGRGELSQTELESADRQVGRGHRSRYENAHSAMRTVLSVYAGLPARDLGFARQCAACGSREHGKPRLTSAKRGRPPSFSLARNQRFAAIAVCADGEIGVDMEDTQEMPPATHAWCHPNEAQKLSSLPPGRREAAALRLWVRREAVLKGVGLGLGDGARDLDLSGLPARLTGWTSVSRLWRVTDVANADNLVISVAAAGAASTVTFRSLLGPHSRLRPQPQGWTV